MKKIEELWLCEDCTMAAVNDDYTGIDSDQREREVRSGLENLGPHLVIDTVNEDEDPCDLISRETWAEAVAAGGD